MLDQMDKLSLKSCNMPENIKDILERYVESVLEKYDTHIRKIILFGSYARGEYNKDSDLDITVLVDYPRETIGDFRSPMSDITYRLSYDNEIEISPLMQNEEFFSKWINAYPFYNNVVNEGVELYSA